MQLHGAWQDAIAGDRAGGRAPRRATRAARRQAAAFYRRAELHRLRGEFDEAEEAYREASRSGREPQPGLALLRLAQGQADAACAAIRRVVDEAGSLVARSRLLPAHVEIMLAAGDVDGGARRAPTSWRRSPPTSTRRCCARGRPMPRAPCCSRRATRARAWPRCARRGGAWQELDAPHEAARARVLIGLACRGLGDEDGAAMELDAARWTFVELGAAPDVARIDALSPIAAARGRGRADAPASSRSSASSPPARPTARSRPTSSSARRPSPAT